MCVYWSKSMYAYIRSIVYQYLDTQLLVARVQPIMLLLCYAVDSANKFRLLCSTV